MGLKDSFKKALQKKGSLSEATGKKGAGHLLPFFL